MQEKEVENPVLISNFEIDQGNNKVIVYINPKIYPLSLIKKSASSFEDKAWVAIDGNAEEEILVELRPKKGLNLELLAREFNNALLKDVRSELKTDNAPPALISKIKEVITNFVVEEEGRVSKQSILTLGAILAAFGLAGSVSGSHLCSTGTGTDGGGGEGGGGGGGCEGGGGCG